MGTTQVKLLKAPPQSFVLQSAHFRQTPFPPCRYRGTSQQLFSQLVNELTEKENITKKLKATDQMAWVRKMNNILERVREIINKDLIVE